MPLLLLALLLFAACSPKPSETLSPPISGTWVVADTLILSAADSVGIAGTTFAFSAEQAIVPGDTCISPVYMSETVEATAYLRDNFGLSPEDVGFQDASITTTQVRCEGAFWHTPGSWVLQQDSLTLIPWNEVFLRVRPE